MNEYTPQEVSERVKQRAKEKNIILKTMLEECGSSVNGLTQGSSKKGIGSFTIARIADYLDCSVDYLLGRTDKPNPESETHIGENNSGNFVNGNNGDNSPLTIGETSLDEMSASLLKNFNALETTEKARILVMIDDLRKGA